MAKLRIGVLQGISDPPLLSVLSRIRRMAVSAALDQVLLFPSLPCASGDRPDDRWKMFVISCCNDRMLVPYRPSGSLYVDSASPESILRFLKKEFPHAVLIRMNDCSSSEDRDAVRHQLSLGIVPDDLDIPVREYICCKGLYGYPARIPESALWLDQLFSTLKPHRFAHSLAVADTARLMASRFGEDPVKAEKAGLLHDCAKNLPVSEMQEIARRYHVTDDPYFLENPALLHSVVGAVVAENTYGMHDPDILDAIRYHNTGYPGMSRLSMCVCLSDSIEPTRRSYPLLDEVRLLSRQSLEKALLLSLEGTADYVRKKGAFLHPRTRETIAWLKALPAVRD